MKGGTVNPLRIHGRLGARQGTIGLNLMVETQTGLLSIEIQTIKKVQNLLQIVWWRMWYPPPKQDQGETFPAVLSLPLIANSPHSPHIHF